MSKYYSKVFYFSIILILVTLYLYYNFNNDHKLKVSPETIINAGISGNKKSLKKVRFDLAYESLKSEEKEKVNDAFINEIVQFQNNKSSLPNDRIANIIFKLANFKSKKASPTLSSLLVTEQLNDKILKSILYYYYFNEIDKSLMPKIRSLVLTKNKNIADAAVSVCYKYSDIKCIPNIEKARNKFSKSTYRIYTKYIRRIRKGIVYKNNSTH